MSWHWHDDECGWCPCNEFASPAERSELSSGLQSDEPSKKESAGCSNPTHQSEAK